MFKLKLKASLYHFLISAGVIGAFLAFIFSYWYPGALATVAGLTQIVFIMVIIDLTLGPLLTFIVFKPKKPSLLFDLSVIAIFQMSALAYAAHIIYEGHPLYIAYAGNQFTLITANEVNPEEAAHADFRKSKLTGPTLVYVKHPDDPKEAEKLMLEVFSGAPDIDKRPNLYKPMSDHMSDIFSDSIKPEKLLANKSSEREFMKFINKHGDHNSFAFLPLSGKGKNVVWALSRKTGKPVDVINVNPWSMAVNHN